MLVVLDNARDADQVRPLLPGEPGCPVIVTSRDELSGLVAAQGAYPIVVDLMNAAEARQLLANRLGQHRLDAEPDAVNEITGRCVRLPLALATVAARAAARPDFPLTALARQLRDTRDGLEAFATGDAISDVRAVFSWSYHILSPPAAELFRLLGLHPGPDVDVHAAASLAGVPQRHVRAALGELTRAHLLIEQAPGRYRFHDLLRTYAAEQVHACDADAERATALRRMLDYYLHTAHAATVLIRPSRQPLDLPPPEASVTPTVFADGAAAMVWYHAEHQVLLAAVQHAGNAGFDQHAWQLAWALADFLDRQGRSDQLATVQRVALRAARRQGDRAAEASVLRNIARACAELGEFDDAETHLQHALRLFSALGDRIGEADVHANLSSVLIFRARYVTQREGDGAAAQLWYRKGLQHADKAIDIFRSANYRTGLAIALNSAGWVYACVGDGRRALACCEESLALNREIGFREHEAAVRDSLGYIHHQMGHHHEAIACYHRALDLYDEVDAPRAAGHTLSRLGDTHLACGNHEAAGRAWQQAIDVLDAIRHPLADHVRAKLHDLNQDNLGLARRLAELS
jgi:tetratricopeptide (TPR) repeat protein